MNKTDLLEYADYLLKTAVKRVENIENAHKNGLFLAGRDLTQNPAPAVFLAIEEK